MNLPRGLFRLTLASVLTFVSAGCGSYRHSEPRNAMIPATGVKLIRIVSDAGTLKIDGRVGLANLTVLGAAVGSSSRIARSIRLVATRAGDVITIRTVMPKHWFIFGGRYEAALDMAIAVPAGVPIEITGGSGDIVIRGAGPVKIADGSGGIDIQGTTGAVEIDDGSGPIKVNGVDGDVRITDGSGDISVSGVTGNLDVPEDGSGALTAERVAGSVRVGDKGSGSVNVAHVGGDFVVAEKGSGSLQYDDVHGKIAVPQKR